MKSYRAAPVSRGWVIDSAAVRRVTGKLKDDYQIAAPSIDTSARLLSGGNLQRLILAREIDTGPLLMVAVQPTRGLDVGAIESVHRLLLDRRAGGAATLLISEDIDEILALSDRVAVMYEGQVVGLFDTADADVGEIGLLMTGGGPDPGLALVGGSGEEIVS
jgi:simple sugar transport system ATP-binding protein